MEIFNRIMRTGIRGDTPEEEARNIRVVNFCILVAILNSLFYSTTGIIIDIKNGMPGAILIIILMGAMVFGLYLNKIWKYKVAKMVLMISMITSVFINSWIFLSKGFYIHVYFILFAIAAFIIYEYKEKISYFFVFLNITLFYIVEHIPGIKIIPMESRFYSILVINMYRVTAILTCFFSILAVVIYLKKVAYDSQRLLEEKLNLINKKNIEINTQKEKLEKSNSTKERLFTIIAHDLKGPIGNFSNMLKVLGNGQELVTDMEKTEFILKELKKSAESSYLLLENLLDWARVQKNDIITELEYFDVSYVIDDIINLYRSSAANKGLTVEKNVDTNYYVYADKKMCGVILRNVFSNAIKFTPTGGKIEISVSTEDDYTVILIKDNGIGIKEERVARIMSKNMADLSTRGTNGEKGTGLGISLSIDFAQKNNGKLKIQSAEKSGTKVTLYLPNSKK